MLDKPSNAEDEYFAREDVEKKRKLAFQQAGVMADQQKEALRTLHYMKCPKCGFDLHTLKRGEVDLDTCFNCKGLWIDAGELEHFRKQLQTGEERHAVVSALLNMFKND
ncbi:MAG TPA: zf-TFIIB domain-containing protein [Myxococcaceae bacterium]|nr:zf-TFIIB domain-containing protein [Myxococcaceae bacterium]